MRLLPSLLAVALAAVCSRPCSAQVTISEIDASSTQAWVELLNRGANEVDLSNWSLYHATKTPHRSGTYWFAFPAGTRIAADGFLRIHWGAPLQATTDPREIYTGDKNWHFLFGHGFETLDPEQGALAVVRTSLNQEMNNPNIFEDWVSWGTSGFARENIAVQSMPFSLWKQGSFVPKPEGAASIALHPPLDADPTPLDAWLVDYSPTPLAVNIGENSAIALDPRGCEVNKPEPVALRVEGIPYHGNKDVSLVVDHTQGPAFFEGLILMIANHGHTAPFGPCFVLELRPGTWMLPAMGTQFGSTTVPAPLIEPSLRGMAFDIQALVYTPSLYFSFSNRVRLRISQ